MNSSPFSYASTGLCRCTLGKPGIAPSSTSSRLGCSAAVTDTLSPSQLRPAVIQRTCTSDTAGAFVMPLCLSAMEVASSEKRTPNALRLRHIHGAGREREKRTGSIEQSTSVIWLPYIADAERSVTQNEGN